MKKIITTGIDVGTSSVRIVVSEYIEGEELPHVLAMVNKKSRGVRHGYVTNTEEAAKSIKEATMEAEKISKTKIELTYAGIGGISLESSVASGEIDGVEREIKEEDLNKATENSEENLKKTINRYVLHCIPTQYKLDGKKVLGRPIGMRGTKLEVKTLFITCLDQHRQSLISAIEGAGILVEEVIASPIASSNAVLTKIQKTAGSVLVDIGAETVSVAVFEDGIPISLEVFAIGSTDITNDIALGFKIPLEEAELLKVQRRDTGTTKKKLDEIINARLSDIFDLVQSHLKKIGKNSLLPAGAIIIGGGSSLGSIDNFARDYLDLPAHASSLVVPVVSYVSQAPKEGIVNKKVIESSWSVSYGLCVMFGENGTEILTGKNWWKRFRKLLNQFLP